MIGLNISLFVQHDDLEIELQILVVLFVLKVFDDLFGLDEINVDHLEETHACLWLFLQNPKEPLEDFSLVLELSQQLDSLLVSLVLLCFVLAALGYELPPLEGFF